MAFPTDGGGTLGLLIDDLEAASKVPTKRRQAGFKSTVERAATLLYDRGAIPDELARLVDLLTVRNQLDQASLGALVRNLYPAAKIDDEVVLKVVGALGHGQLKPPFTLQSLLLRWLVMVYHLLKNPGLLDQAYGVLFNLLETAVIRAQLCHILALITRRKHVKPFRIHALLGLSRATGNDPPVIGLLRVYKNYYPEIIVGDATRGRASAFKHPDMEWRSRLDDIQRDRLEDRDDRGPRNGFSVNHALSKQMNGAKRSLLPIVQTQHAQENSVTLEEIDSADAFVEKLDKIEMPTQLVAVLADPLLQKLLLLRPDGDAFSRISNWVSATLNDIASGDGDWNLLFDMIDIVHDFVANTKVFPPMVETFVQFLFKVWDRVKKKDAAIDTVTYAPLRDWNVSYKSLFFPLQQALINDTSVPIEKCQEALLKFFTSLLRRWMIIMLSEEQLDSLPTSAISDLMNHVNKLTWTLTLTSPTVPIHLAILDFYETSAALITEPKLLKHVDITIPPAMVVYRLLFSPSPVVLSRLCGILAAHKRAWESLMSPTSPVSRTLTRYERDQVSAFNGYLMDVCNCLWRGRAFATSDLNAQGCRIPRSLEPALDGYLRKIDSSLSLGSVFGLTHSPVLGFQAIMCLREMEDTELLGGGELHARHAGPVSPSSLVQLANRGGLKLTWQAYRSAVLRYLETKGFPGVPELMYNTMKNLMKERKQ